MGDNFESVAGDQLRAFIERIERLEEERSSIAKDIGEVYAEAKGNGYDRKVIKIIVAKRRQDPNARMELEALVELYETALGMRSADDEDDFEPPSRARAPARTREAGGLKNQRSEEINSSASNSGPLSQKSTVEEIAPDDGSDSEYAPSGELVVIPEHDADGVIIESQPEPREALSQIEGGSVAKAENPSQAAMPAQTGAVEALVAQPAAPIPQALAGAADTASGDSVDPSAVPAVRRPGDVWIENTPPEPVVWHDYARCFPEHWGMSLADLADSIRADGVRDPIVKIGNQILDGRARYTTARGLLIDYPVTEYAGTDPLLDVIRWNLEARTLGANERKLIATKLIKLCPDRGEEITSAFGLDHGRAAAE